MGISKITENSLLLIQTSEISAQSHNVSRCEFMKLPLEEKRRILAEQAEAILIHYQEDSEWQELQTGDLIPNLG